MQRREQGNQGIRGYRWLLALGFAGLLSGCFQAQLNGSVAGAEITVTDLTNPNLVHASAVTQDVAHWQNHKDGRVWSKATELTKLYYLGIFNLRVGGLEDNRYYLVTARGGEDADADRDNRIDSSFTPVQGEWHAIMRGSELKRIGPKVTALSEAVYQWLEPHLAAMNGDQIAWNLNRAALRVMSDVDNDGVTDWYDALLWNRQLFADDFRGDLNTVNLIADNVTVNGSIAARRSLANDFLGIEVSLETQATPDEYFGDLVADAVAICQTCHIEGGVADAGGARLIFGPAGSDDATNAAALSAFLTDVEGASGLILSKIQGVDHGGGTWYTSQSPEYGYLATYVALVTGEDGSIDRPDGDFWDGITMADARQTLRRAALIFAGRLPTEAEYTQAESGDAGLRAAILALLEGDLFHEFLIRGANDRLHTDAFLNGLFAEVADLNAGALYPVGANKYSSFDPTSQEALDEKWRWAGRWEFGIARAPLELIAHVVQNDLPYTEILTADYTMVNREVSEVLRSGVGFDGQADHTVFKPGQNRGQTIPDENLISSFEQDVGTTISSHGGFIDYPHAGVLNTQSFLQRYPTTETNRNRARARWTYLHFLDVDIEKSASRTTDPEALADTDNPTMNNPACTVCHEVMDPVAGAYQNYGNEGWYRSAWGGMDSLPDSYKWSAAAIPGGGQSADIMTANGVLEEYRFTEDLTAGEWYVTIQFNNPDWSEGEDLPRGMAIETLRISEGFQETFFSSGLALLSDDSLINARAQEFGGRLALWEENSFVSFPVDVRQDGEVTLSIRAVGNTMGDGVPPNFSVAFLSTPPAVYEEGDTWFRDMRTPGLPGSAAPDNRNSLQWLAQQIAADPRFARATVKFWWPAVMGADVLEPPGSVGDVGYQQLLYAFDQQTGDIQTLADAFIDGGFNLKQLLVDMAMTGWFRANGVEPGAAAGRELALETVGTGRLLTPAELDNKTRAVVGMAWEEGESEWTRDGTYSALQDRFRIYYGGIDSVGVRDRARQLTSLMSNVAQRQAVAHACAATVYDFMAPDGERRLFNGIARSTSPLNEFFQNFPVAPDRVGAAADYQQTGRMEPGEKRLRISFTNDYWHEVEGDRNLVIDRLEVRGPGGNTVISYPAENLREVAGFEETVNEWGTSGDVNWGPTGADGWKLWSQGFVSVPFTAPSSGNYTVVVKAWAEQAGPDLPNMLVSVEGPTPWSNTAGEIAIREKLVELHALLLGEVRQPNDAEINAAYDLLVETWQGRLERFPDSGSVWYWPDDNCHMPGDYWELDEAVQAAASSDPIQMVGSWVSVLMYLMTHYSYLHE